MREGGSREGRWLQQPIFIGSISRDLIRSHVFRKGLSEHFLSLVGNKDPQSLWGGCRGSWHWSLRRFLPWCSSCLRFLSSGWPPTHLHPSPCVATWYPARVRPLESTQGKGQDESPLGQEPLFLLLSDYSLKDVRACAQEGFKVGAAMEVVYLKLGVSLATCKGILREIKGEWQGPVTPMLILFPPWAPPGPCLPLR